RDQRSQAGCCLSRRVGAGRGLADTRQPRRPGSSHGGRAHRGWHGTWAGRVRGADLPGGDVLAAGPARLDRLAAHPEVGLRMTTAPPLAPPAALPRGPGRRRPSGSPPPLPRHIKRTGVRWLIALVVTLVLTPVVFAEGGKGLAVPVTIVDDTIVRWIAG